ncbi:MAG TPA: hypothetical protein VM050_09360 [Patescibacteria group bacterium]|nr:hypothetical protein [Patescibacteria group bacterium]
MADSTSIRETITELVMMSRPLTLRCSLMAWLLGVSIATSGLWPELDAHGLGLCVDDPHRVVDTLYKRVRRPRDGCSHDEDPLLGGSGVLPTMKIPRRMAIQAAVVSLITGVAVEFLHRDEFRERYSHVNAEYPSAYMKRGEELSVFVSREEMNSQQSLSSLMDLVRARLDEITG